MRRVISFLCMFTMLYAAVAQPGKSSRVSAMDRAAQESVDLIIQTDGSTQTLADQIIHEGGTIRYAYQNLPVIAATIPAGSLNSVYQHPDVISVSKDHLLTLLDTPSHDDPARDLPAYPLDESGIHIMGIDPTSLKPGEVPLGYGGFLLSGAYDIWEQAHLGSGSVVAVVDTGTVPNPCLGESVIGTGDFPDGFNATGDGIPATDPRNLRHGTHIAGVIASACVLDFRDNPAEPLNQAVAKYFHRKDDFVFVFGQAPAAQIYPVKVFDTTGEGSPTSDILYALDHLLTLKKQGDLDIDVVNLSFGGPTGYDGRDALDSFLEQFRELGVLVVAAAGNNGPLPNSLASPATSYDSIAVGALDYAPASRVVYEYLGLTTPELGPGQGEVMRPTDELRVADFSSRGPMSDGRFGPDLVAPGMWSFQYAVTGGFEWYSGTSYAAAAVSGSAALLNAYYEAENQVDTPWLLWRNSLLLGADPSIIREYWQDLNTAGYGALDAPAALEILKSGAAHLEHPGRSEKLGANILANPMSGDIQAFESELVTLPPSQSQDYLVDISSSTSRVNLQVYDIFAPDNSAHAYWPNSLKILVQSAKRSAVALPIDTYWEPYWDGGEFTIVIEDGTWSLDGVPLVYQPMEPGLMKISLVADYANESPVSFKVHLTREQDPQREQQKPYSQGILNMGDVITVPVDIPEGTGRAVFDLAWNRDWQKFPTSDIDLLVFDPHGNLVPSAGATWNAPERVVLIDPAPGTWNLQVEGREMYKTDLYRLYVQTETDPQFDIISQHPASDSSMGTGNDSASPYIIWLPIIP